MNEERRYGGLIDKYYIWNLIKWICVVIFIIIPIIKYVLMFLIMPIGTSMMVNNNIKGNLSKCPNVSMSTLISNSFSEVDNNITNSTMPQWIKEVFYAKSNAIKSDFRFRGYLMSKWTGCDFQ